MGPTEALEEFVSTFEEWHYLVGGLSIGTVLGLVLGLAFALLYERSRRNLPVRK